MTIIRRLRQTGITLLVICLMLASLSAAGLISRPTAQGQPAAQATDLTAVEVVEQVSPAVVTVHNMAMGSGIFGEAVPQGAGTGFIIDPEGHIVTNWHVVTGGDAFAVLLKDGTQVEAELIGMDPRDDIAVVKIDPASVPATVSFGDSDALKPGQEVLAIGSPLGAFTNTVTAGIVSAIGRNQIETGGGSFCQNYSNLIQHDAAINQGNSGGPLFNMRGEVVGVNTLGIPTSQQGLPVQGMFFAVPSSIVQVAVRQLIETGTIEHPYFGISQQQLDPTTASANNLPVGSVYIADVEPGGPAAEAGLQPNDVITAIDGTEITFENSLSDMLFNYSPGDTVQLTVLRGGEQMTIDLTLGQAPQELFEQCTLQGTAP
jgi:2-alkenal reductase